MYCIMLCVYVYLYSISWKRLKRNGACSAKHCFIVQNICSFCLNELDSFIVHKTDVLGMQTDPLCNTIDHYLSRRLHRANDLLILSDHLFIVQKTDVSARKSYFCANFFFMIYPDVSLCKNKLCYLCRLIHCAHDEFNINEESSTVQTTES